MTDPACLLVGKVLRPHGRKGKVLIASMTDFPQRFEPGSRLLIGNDESRLKEVEVVESTTHKRNYLVAFVEPVEGDDDEQRPVDPFTLKGKYLFVSADDLVECEEDEYYYYELIGNLVMTTDGDEVGVVGSVLRTGPQDLLVVEREGGEEVFVPVVSAIIKEVDLEAGRVVIDPPDGLLDVNVKSC